VVKTKTDMNNNKSRAIARKPYYSVFLPTPSDSLIAIYIHCYFNSTLYFCVIVSLQSIKADMNVKL